MSGESGGAMPATKPDKLSSHRSPLFVIGSNFPDLKTQFLPNLETIRKRAKVPSLAESFLDKLYKRDGTKPEDSINLSITFISRK